MELIIDLSGEDGWKSRYRSAIMELTNSVYCSIAAMEPEDRTPQMETVLIALESITHEAQHLIGLCNDDTVFHEQDWMLKFRQQSADAWAEWQDVKDDASQYTQLIENALEKIKGALQV